MDRSRNSVLKEKSPKSLAPKRKKSSKEFTRTTKICQEIANVELNGTKVVSEQPLSVAWESVGRGGFGDESRGFRDESVVSNRV